MANRIQRVFDGPWLLNEKSLRDLDAIITEYWSKFELRRERLLRNEANELRKNIQHLEIEHREAVNRQIRNYRETSELSRSYKRLSIYSQDVAFRGDSFDAAFKAKDLLDEKPTGFDMQILSGDIRCHLMVDASNPSQRLLIEAQPGDVEEVQQIYTLIYEWARDIRRKSMGQWIWGKVANFSQIILIAGAVFYVFLFMIVQSNSLQQADKDLYDLYVNGITNANVVQAVNLLARLQVGGPSLVPWLIAYPIAWLYLAIVLHIRTKVVIRIGKGRDALNCWKVWQVVVLAVPTAVVTRIVVPYIIEIVKKFFS